MPEEKTTKKQADKKPFFQRRIPTLVGIGVLLIGLVAGTIIFSQGTGVFSPRATPETTPAKIRVSNVTDSGFTVSFITTEATTAFVKYGTEENRLDTQSSDDRDQLSGTVEEYQTHHITVRGLEPSTQYYYVIGTGTGSFDNNGQPFRTQTAQRSGIPSAAKTIYGSVVTNQGNPAEGALVYVKTANMGEMSSLVKSSGSWAIPLSNARTADGSAYAQIADENSLTVHVQGANAGLTSQGGVLVSNAQPVPNITLGQPLQVAAAPSPSPSVSPSLAPSPQDSSDDDTSSKSGGLTGLLADSGNKVVLDLTEVEAATGSTTISSGSPKITGQAAPNVTVSIQVNSETQIDQFVTADENGNFELDLEALGSVLEPGEHTVTYSYTDPNTNQVVTKTETFYVEDNTSSQIAQAETSPDPTPFSSSSPFPVGGDASGSAEASDSGEASGSGRVTNPSTESAIPVSGSVGTTFALIIGGLFFIIAAAWSWWIAHHLEEELAV